MNADKFEKEFYQHQKLDKEDAKQPEAEQPEAATGDVAKVIE